MNTHKFRAVTIIERALYATGARARARVADCDTDDE